MAKRNIGKEGKLIIEKKGLWYFNRRNPGLSLQERRNVSKEGYKSVDRLFDYSTGFSTGDGERSLYKDSLDLFKAVGLDGKEYLVDQYGRKLSHGYEKIEDCFHEGTLKIKEKDKEFLIDTEGKIISKKYDGIVCVRPSVYPYEIQLYALVEEKTEKGSQYYTVDLETGKQIGETFDEVIIDQCQLENSKMRYFVFEGKKNGKWYFTRYRGDAVCWLVDKTEAYEARQLGRCGNFEIRIDETKDENFIKAIEKYPQCIAQVPDRLLLKEEFQAQIIEAVRQNALERCGEKRVKESEKKEILQGLADTKELFVTCLELAQERNKFSEQIKEFDMKPTPTNSASIDGEARARK